VRLLISILGRSLPRGSKLTYLAAYEGIKEFFISCAEGFHEEQERVQWTGERIDGEAAAVSQSSSKSRSELMKAIAAFLLDNRNPPKLNQSEPETVRMARARALLAYACCLLHVDRNGLDVTEDPKSQASTAVELWLQGERSSSVRDLLQQVQTRLNDNHNRDR
jgi:hypothetical protein